jgi:hypothetical protein
MLAGMGFSPDKIELALGVRRKRPHPSMKKPHPMRGKKRKAKSLPNVQ